MRIAWPILAALLACKEVVPETWTWGEPYNRQLVGYDYLKDGAQKDQKVKLHVSTRTD
jgi:hypothetical protein